MKIKLTDRQVVFLGWDGNSQAPRPTKRVSGGYAYDLDDSRLDEVRQQAELFANGGCDPCDTVTAKALLRKLETL